MLLPLPVFFALYRVIQGLGHTPPKYLSPSSRMYQDIVAAHGHLQRLRHGPVVRPPSAITRSVWAALPYWILLLVLAGTGYLQSSMMMSRNPNASQNPQMRLMKYLPLIFVVFFIRFPAGVLLYYAMSNVCRIVQQDAMYRFDPKVKALVNQEVQEVEANTHEIDEQNASARQGRGRSRPADPRPWVPTRLRPRVPGARRPGVAGTPASKDAGARPASKGAGANSGRRRGRPGPRAATAAFELCWPRPAGQQQATASSKALAAGGRRRLHSRRRRRPPTPTGASQTATNGSKTTGSTNGKPQRSEDRKADRKPTPKGGHRTNRKRRGR